VFFVTIDSNTCDIMMIGFAASLAYAVAHF